MCAILEISSKIVKREFRANIEVLSRIATAFSQNSSMKKTHLHLATRISWTSFMRYLEWLQSKNYMISKMDGKEEKYELTETGREMFGMLLQFHDHVRFAEQ
ncbi:MAG TPA: winged helix-turn-helix domain-containing protein [Nitrosopumilaceae archaeon]|nr:winged helix-turn-helix domain-containing protein [Nitrosopumilaceae archaeon]